MQPFHYKSRLRLPFIGGEGSDEKWKTESTKGKAVLFDHSSFLQLITYDYISHKFHIGILVPLSVYGCKLLKGD